MNHQTLINPFGFLPTDMKEALIWINSKVKFSITGSISLRCHRVINRLPNDIDIVVEDLAAVKKLGADLQKVCFSEVTGLESLNEHQETSKQVQTRLTYNGIKICVFLSPNQDKQLVTVVHRGRHENFYISHPKYAIWAKTRYVKSLIGLSKIMPLSDKKQERMRKHIGDIGKFIKTFPDIEIYDESKLILDENIPF